MKRHLIWIIAGSATIGLTVPAFAAMQSVTAPDDNGVPGELRGNCDEAEHAKRPELFNRDRAGADRFADADHGRYPDSADIDNHRDHAGLDVGAVEHAECSNDVDR